MKIFSTLRRAALAVALTAAGCGLASAAVNLTTDPDYNVTQEKLSGNIYVTFTDYTEVNFDSEWAYNYYGIWITGTNGYDNESARFYKESGNRWYIKLAEDITESAVYTFYFNSNPVDQDGNEISMPTLSFTVGEGDVTGITGEDYFEPTKVTPAPGVVVSIPYIQLEFDAKVSVLSSAGIYLLNGDKEMSISVSALDDYTLYIATGNIEEAGTYELRIVAGAIACGGMSLSDPYSCYFTINEEDTPDEWDGTVRCTPAEGRVDELSSISVKYFGAKSLKTDEPAPANWPRLYTLDSDGNRTSTYVSTYMNSVGGNTANINLSKTVTAEGKYQLVIPAAYLMVDGSYPTSEVTVDYEISSDDTELPFEYTYEVTPAENEVPADWTYINISFTNVSDLKNVGAWPATGPTVYGVEGEGDDEVITDTYAGTYTTNVYRYSYHFGEYTRPTSTGRYKYVVPAGWIQMTSADGTQVRTNDEIIVYFNYNAESDKKEEEEEVVEKHIELGYTVTPAEDEVPEEWTTITVSFTGFDSMLEAGSQDNLPAVWLLDDNGDKLTRYRGTTKVSGLDYIFSFSTAPTEAGRYVYIIPERFLEIYTTELTERTPEIAIYFNYEGKAEDPEPDPEPDSLTTITADRANTSTGVYTLAGVRIADDAQTLPAGLYVINGQKVMIKQ